MSVELYHDAFFLLFPDLKKTADAVIEEAEAGMPVPQEALEWARRVKTRIDNLRDDMAVASRRLNGVTIPIEFQELEEVSRYGFTALKRRLVSGDDKYHVFFNEISYETRLFRSAFTSLSTRAAETLNGNISLVVEINDAAPLLAVKVASRSTSKAKVVVADAVDVYGSDAIRGIQSDYIKKYLLDGEVLRIDEASEYEGKADLVAFTFIDAWRYGFRKLFAAARRLLAPGGVLAALLPLNSREGLRTILWAWGVTEFLDVDELRKIVRSQGYVDPSLRVYGPFVALMATAK